MSETNTLAPEFDTSELDFSVKVDEITGRQLTPKGLRSYADDALEDLIRLINDVTEQYDRQPTIAQVHNKEQEDTALSYFGFDPDYINFILDFISSKAEEINKLDDQVSHMRHTRDRTIVAPNTRTPITRSGEGSFEAKFEPRLNTVLFLLSNKFGIDLDKADPDQIILSDGPLDRNTMRKVSYNVIELPAMNRTILVCDQVGHATYVFDNELLNEQGIAIDTLLSLNPDELRDLFVAHPKLGISLKSTQSYVEDIASLMDDIPEAEEKITSGKTVEFLRPDGVLSGAAIAAKINEQYGARINHKTIYRVADQLEAEGLITRTSYDLGPKRTIPGYTDSDYEQIVARLEEADLLYPVAPADVSSLTTLVGDAVGRHSTAYDTVFADVLARAEQAFGTLPKYRFLSKTSIGVTKDQLPIVDVMIEEHVDKLRALAAAKKVLKDLAAEETRRPEGTMTLPQIGEASGVSSSLYIKAFNNVEPAVRAIADYKHGPNGFKGFNAEQVAVIEAEIERLKTSDREPGRWTAPELADELGVSSHIVREALEQISAPHRTERVNNKPSPTYDPDIVEALRKNEKVIYMANLPHENEREGVVSLAKYAKSRRMSADTAKKVISKYHMPVGDFGFGPNSKPAAGLLPEDQRFIDDVLDKKDTTA